MGGSVSRKPKKKAPLLISNIGNSSEMKLPEIRVAHYRNNNANTRESSLPSIYDDKQERLRAKLEMLYHVKMPKQYKSMKQH